MCTIRFHTVGCRLNQYETEKMAAQLCPFGFRRVQRGEPADLYVINTCTVTHKADKDSRYYVRRARRENPNARIVVVGCYVEHEPERVAGMEGVDVLVYNSEKDAIAEILQRRLPELFGVQPDAAAASEVMTDFHERNRAWIKISDGCDQDCSYCLVTRVRGPLINRPFSEILEEVNALVAYGYQEIVLTGVNIGYYTDNTVSPPLRSTAEVCRAIVDQTCLRRLRLSSIEAQTVTNELVHLVSSSGGRVCRYLHVPMQSGSSRILRLMHRPYDRDTFVERLWAIKQAEPEAIIGADVIVGFPGETSEDFAQSRSLAESGLIDYLHVFSYSDRPGTTAAALSGKVPHETIRERNQILTAVSGELRFRSHQRQVGKLLEVIAEYRKTAEGYHWGISDNYIRVKLPSRLDSGRRIVTVKITRACPDHVEGEVVS